MAGDYISSARFRERFEHQRHQRFSKDNGRGASSLPVGLVAHLVSRSRNAIATVHVVLADACDGKPRATTTVTVDDSASDAPVHVGSLGVSPLQALTVKSKDRPHRLGLDLLGRGDFEYARLYGAHDRTWIEARNASLKTGDNNLLEIRVPAGEQTVRSGMKVFERVITLSNPATVSGRIKVDGDVRVRFLLQRRRATETLEDALVGGPIRQIGVALIPRRRRSACALKSRYGRVPAEGTSCIPCAS